MHNYFLLMGMGELRTAPLPFLLPKAVGGSEIFLFIFFHFILAFLFAAGVAKKNPPPLSCPTSCLSDHPCRGLTGIGWQFQTPAVACQPVSRQSYPRTLVPSYPRTFVPPYPRTSSISVPFWYRRTRCIRRGCRCTYPLFAERKSKPQDSSGPPRRKRAPSVGWFI